MKGLLGQLQAYSEFHPLTQAVIFLKKDARFQSVRLFRVGEDWLMGWELFPAPGWLVWARSLEDKHGFYLGKMDQKPASHPLQLYLKAHFINLRVTAAHLSTDGAIELHFSKENYALRLHSDRAWLVVECLVPGMKAFKQSLRLARWIPPGQTATPKLEAANPIPTITPEEKKRRRLIENIQSDLKVAQLWLERWTALCARLQMDPSLWGQRSEWSEEEWDLIQPEITAGKLPAFSASTRGVALDHIFQARRRAERKQAGARARLEKVQRQEVKPLLKTQTPASTTVEKDVPQRPRKKPGIWVEVMEGLWARIGRSASENDELFRQARDRDLWFHVRGGAGAHVWVPRGQPGFGAKSEASSDLIYYGCQLALLNSSASKTGHAVVDFTERRHLRKIRSAVGAVEILRSETKAVRTDEAFERKILKKET